MLVQAVDTASAVLSCSSSAVKYKLVPALPWPVPRLQLDPQGNLFNIYRDEQGQRTITPVGNISQMQRFKVRRLRPAVDR
jgi:hypothetical protein